MTNRSKQLVKMALKNIQSDDSRHENTLDDFIPSYVPVTENVPGIKILGNVRIDNVKYESTADKPGISHVMTIIDYESSKLSQIQNADVVMESNLKQENGQIQFSISHNLEEADCKFVNNNAKELANLGNMIVSESDSEENLPLSHWIGREGHSSNSFHCLEREKIFMDAHKEIGDIYFNDDSDAGPSYVPSGQSSGSEAEKASIKNAARNIAFSENIHGAAKKVTKKEIRKQIRNVDQWKATKRAMKTLSGKEHISKRGTVIPEKFMKAACRPCRKKCSEKIKEDVRKEIFKSYWDVSKNWDVKRQFIICHVRSKPPKRERPKDYSRSGQRKQTIFDYFYVNGTRIEVCKVFFSNTLGISETVVRTALKKGTIGGFAIRDMRGRHIPPNKLQENVLDRVRSHISSFPIYQSHYSREQSAKSYLGSDLNTRRLYELYKQKCGEDCVPPKEIVKHWAYKRIFDREFNLGFKKPSNDTCDACDGFILVDSNDKTKVVRLDLQKCLPTPYLSNCQSFYLLKLWTLNLTIYDATEKKF